MPENNPAGPSNQSEAPADPHGSRPPPPGGFQLKASRSEAFKYDFVAARPKQKTTNMVESIAHLIKSCLGGGVVAIHEAYKQCGLFTALFMNIFLGMFVAYCMHVLARCAQKIYGRVQVPQMSFPDVAEASFRVSPWPKLRGKWSKCFRYSVDACISVDLFGSCCVYQVVIARTIKQLVEHSQAIKDEDGIHIRIYIACLLIPCILICMITSLKYLAPFSIVADFFILLTAGATVYYGVKAATVSPIDFPHYKSIPGLLEFIGVCVFSVEGVGVTLAIENNMTNPRKVWVVIYSGMAIVVAIVMVMGFFGYWGFGELSKSPITVNFPMEVFPIILKVCMALMIYVTFALNFWVPFNLVWVYLQRKHKPQKFWFWERVYRAVLVTAITLIAITFPNVSKFMGVLGSLCLSLMGFIFPAMIELILDWADPGLGVMKWRLLKAIAIMTFGVILFFLGTYSNFKEMIIEVFYQEK